MCYWSCKEGNWANCSLVLRTVSAAPPPPIITELNLNEPYCVNLFLLPRGFILETHFLHNILPKDIALQQKRSRTKEKPAWQNGLLCVLSHHPLNITEWKLLCISRTCCWPWLQFNCNANTGTIVKFHSLLPSSSSSFSPPPRDDSRSFGYHTAWSSLYDDAISQVSPSTEF